MLYLDVKKTMVVVFTSFFTCIVFCFDFFFGGGDIYWGLLLSLLCLLMRAAVLENAAHIAAHVFALLHGMLLKSIQLALKCFVALFILFC